MIRKVIYGDCLDKMSLLPDKYFDLILTDLPYGNFTACKWDTIIPFDELWNKYLRIIKDYNAIILFSSQPFSSLVVNSKIDLYRYSWIWEKERGTGFVRSSFQPLRITEEILVFSKSAAVFVKGKKSMNYFPQMIKLDKPYNHALPIYKSDSDFVRNNNGDLNNRKYKSYTHKHPTNKLVFSRDKIKLHPTQKPIKLCEYLIKTYTNENDIILDSCSGSFTTAVAADNLKRQWICIEKEEEYVKIGVDRINKNAELLGLEKVNYE